MITSIDHLSFEEYSKNDKIVYDAMKIAALKRKRAGTGAFGIRPLNSRNDPLRVLSLEQAIIPVQRFDFARRFQHLGTVLDRMVQPSDREDLTVALQDHLSTQGDTVNTIYTLPHLSIADVPIFLYSLIDAKLRRAKQAEAARPFEPQSVHTIAGREIGLLTMEGLALDGSTGYLVEDALAILTNIHQTIPKGYQNDISPELVKMANSRFMLNYQAALQKGGQTFIVALNGEEPVLQNGKLRFNRLNANMKGLLYMPNKSRFECEEGLEAVPVAIDTQPFNEDGSLKEEPAAMTFKIGTPRKVRDTVEAHSVVEDLVIMHKEIKLPTTPELVYPEPAVKLGRVAAERTRQGL
jgi:hypothetical protein